MTKTAIWSRRRKAEIRRRVKAVVRTAVGLAVVVAGILLLKRKLAKKNR
jgi:hypothetical protein